eukprot:CAMPEP_0172838668 /NCGR_PEP_ID=MMETSP1075-20121228/28034_1 /TAXON_ID=2916 /ORGANISM="Ceratium fusus, Strain PA161109" /LENGTH=203 /DNA_ID=CAMNT_0013682211 /DNA_START=59 /DNA_END=672 /DNA_ORIENTATION=+
MTALLIQRGAFSGRFGMQLTLHHFSSNDDLVAEGADEVVQFNDLKSECQIWAQAVLDAAPRDSRVARKAEPEAQVVVKALEEFDGNLLEAVRVLELTSPEASEETVRAAYRRLARIEHPDVSERQDADRRFRRISVAFDLLTNDAGRARVTDAVVEAKKREKEQQADQIEVEVSEEIWVFGGVFLAMVTTALVATSLGAGNFR